MKEFEHPFFDDIRYFEKLNSTSKKAEQSIRSRQISGNFLLIANTQTSGIGRRDNFWFSPAGGIWITAGLYGFTVASDLTIFTGICLHQTFLQLYPELQKDLKIKWPNDIFLKGKKLSGIITKYLPAFKYHLIGIGINTNILEFPQTLADNSISLQKYLNSKIENSFILKKFFDIFSENLPTFVEKGFDQDYFNTHSLLNGKQIELDTDYKIFSGTCKGINKKGAILIELKDGMIQPFFAGSVSKFLNSDH